MTKFLISSLLVGSFVLSQFNLDAASTNVQSIKNNNFEDPCFTYAFQAANAEEALFAPEGGFDLDEWDEAFNWYYSYCNR